MAAPPLKLGAEDIRRLVPTNEVIDATPPRLRAGRDRGGCDGDHVSPDNVSIGLPTLHATVLWHADGTGRPSAVLDGRTVTSLL